MKSQNNNIQDNAPNAVYCFQNGQMVLDTAYTAESFDKKAHAQRKDNNVAPVSLSESAMYGRPEVSYM
jgi:hypothetical protein